MSQWMADALRKMKRKEDDALKRQIIKVLENSDGFSLEEISNLMVQVVRREPYDREKWIEEIKKNE